MRRLVQVVSTLLQNSYWAFPWTRNLYQGPLKQICTPGLNCYSCPAAVTSCPLGTLQHFLGSIRPALRWGTYRLGFYIFGFLLAVGLVGGRVPCAWLCPFGLVQDLLYKISLPKFSIPHRLTWLRYPIMGVTVIGMPLSLAGTLGYGEAWFCRLLCPAGTLEASGLFLLVPDLSQQLGPLWFSKAAVLLLVLVLAALSYRPYCRVLCPLGLLYGFFNRTSLVGLEHDPALCRQCGRCQSGCRCDLDPRTQHDSTDCMRCLSCATERCEHGALRIRIGVYRRQPAAGEG